MKPKASNPLNKQAIHSQVYFNDYDENNHPRSRPRNVLPYAIGLLTKLPQNQPDDMHNCKAATSLATTAAGPAEATAGGPAEAAATAGGPAKAELFFITY